MCWRPIGGEVWRTQEASGPPASALFLGGAEKKPDPAATTRIATPRSTNQRFNRRGAPDSTRRCVPAALCCGPWLVRGGGGTRLFFFLATTRQRHQAVARAWEPKKSATDESSATTGAGGSASRKRRP